MLLVPLLGLSQPTEKACFSVKGGFYEESPLLEIFPFYQQHHIRFTINGNRPTAESRLYTEPLLLDESFFSTSDIYTIPISPDNLVYVPDSVRHCIVIRAAVFDENDSCISDVSTNSYFIRFLGGDTHDLPAVSLCLDSLDLFDYEHGIFVPGVFFDSLNPEWSGNYYQTGPGWERPMNIEFYELDNSGINQQAGLRTHGGNSRRLPQKCLVCYARQNYGENRFDHQFFESIPNHSFKHLVLKPFSATWNETGVTDHICNQIAAQLNVETLASRPVLLYLNGEYWGIYFVQELPDDRYLEDHFDIDIENVNIISGWNPIVDCGSATSFVSLFHWFENTDLNDSQNYDWVKDKIDLTNFLDYQILELFFENNDWPANNMRCWQEEDSQWRWIFYDGDACLRWMTFKAFDNAVYVGDELWPSSTRATLFFRKLLDNVEFCQLFNNRFHELLNTVFSYENTAPFFVSIKETLTPEIPFQSDRFGCPNSVDTWNTNMGHTHWFLQKRGEYIEPVLTDFLKPWPINEDTCTRIEVFPNPTNGPITLRLEADHAETFPCSVYDVIGHLVYAQTLSCDVGSNTYSVPLPQTPGLYLVKINDMITKIVRQ